jgi:hypothetical protein
MDVPINVEELPERLQQEIRDYPITVPGSRWYFDPCVGDTDIEDGCLCLVSHVRMFLEYCDSNPIGSATIREVLLP